MSETVPLLDIRDLTVEFATRRGTVRAVQHIDISLAKGETLAIVGESGSGKSVTSYAVMRILDRAGRIAEGAVTFSGIDVRKAGEREMRNLRGREISMIFQNPRAALNPIRKVGHQIEDVLRQHAQAGSDDKTEKAIAILEQVRIARPQERYHAYPFELSGGMCQRVVIALALACRPQLLIADEPTTGLDVTTQKTVMDLIVELTRARGMSTILITHDLGLAAAYCDRVVVMEKGNVVETAAAEAIFVAVAEPVAIRERVALTRTEVVVVAGRGTLPHFLEAARVEATIVAPVLQALAVAVAEPARLSRVADVASVPPVVGTAAAVAAIDALVAEAPAIPVGEAAPELVAIDVARSVGTLVTGVRLAIFAVALHVVTAPVAGILLTQTLAVLEAPLITLATACPAAVVAVAIAELRRRIRRKRERRARHGGGNDESSQRCCAHDVSPPGPNAGPCDACHWCTRRAT